MRRIVLAVRGGSARSTENREAPVRQGADDREYGEYSREEQRSQTGCIAIRMQRHFHHGLLGLAVLAASAAAASRTQQPAYVDATSVPWDPMTETPEALRPVVRWKTLVGGEMLPHPEMLFGELELAPGAVYPAHLHDAPEVYYVLQGRVRWTLGDETLVATPGTTLYAAPGTPHRMVNLGDGVAKMVWTWWAPGGDTEKLSSGYRFVEPIPEPAPGARFPDARREDR